MFTSAACAANSGPYRTARNAFGPSAMSGICMPTPPHLSQPPVRCEFPHCSGLWAGAAPQDPDAFGSFRGNCKPLVCSLLTEVLHKPRSLPPDNCSSNLRAAIQPEGKRSITHERNPTQAWHNRGCSHFHCGSWGPPVTSTVLNTEFPIRDPHGEFRRRRESTCNPH